MKIIHIASIRNNPLDGVCVAVPKHVSSQSELIDVNFINITNEPIENMTCQLKCKGIKELFAILSDIQFVDLVVFHECYVKEYLRIYHYLLKRGIPYIVVPHGELTEKAQRKKRLKKLVANILFFNRFVNKALAIQCLSEEEMSNTHFDKHKFIVTNGVDIPKEFKTSFSECGVKFVYIGRLDSYHKGLDIMLSSIYNVKDFLINNNCRFDIYGPDIFGRLDVLKKMVNKYDLSELVFLHGPVSGSEKVSILLNSDVFIQTSRFEGMPLGVLEALSYGLPCLVTEGTNLSQKINDVHAGWGCRTSSDEVSKVIVQAVLNKKKYPEMGKSGRHLMNSEFSWEQIAKKAIIDYKAIIKK